MRFNPPPNWPEFPPGWMPDPEWRPDPSWPEPPYGWQLWVEDEPTKPSQTQSVPSPQDTNTPIYEFKSHIAGKNADVRVFPNRVEWQQTSHLGTRGKVALGVMTGGASFLATGVRGRNNQDMIMMKSIQSVTSKNSGFRTAVRVATSSGTIEFRCSRDEATHFKNLLLQYSS